MIFKTIKMHGSRSYMPRVRAYKKNNVFGQRLKQLTVIVSIMRTIMLRLND